MPETTYQHDILGIKVLGVMVVVTLVVAVAVDIVVLPYVVCSKSNLRGFYWRSHLLNELFTIT